MWVYFSVLAIKYNGAFPGIFLGDLALFDSLEKSLEMPHYMFCPRKKITFHNFRISCSLIVEHTLASAVISVVCPMVFSLRYTYCSIALITVQYQLWCIFAGQNNAENMPQSFSSHLKVTCLLFGIRVRVLSASYIL